MREIELKFQVPPAAADAVRREAAAAGARRVPMAASYADTADDRLGAADFALRLRREGGRWVQTLKGRGDGLMDRLEHEIELPAAGAAPSIDPTRHAGTPAGDALARLLADGTPLVERFRTEFVRVARDVDADGARVEIAFDEGRIVAGDRAVPICELEFELKAGDPRALLALAAGWTGRHGLWLDVRTKAERGHRLARRVERVAPLPPTVPDLDRAATTAAVFAAMLQSALAQALAGAAEVAGGDDRPEMRRAAMLALRRLRAVLRVLAPWSPDAAAARALQARLATADGDVSGAAFTDAVLGAIGLSLTAVAAGASGGPLDGASVASLGSRIDADAGLQANADADADADEAAVVAAMTAAVARRAPIAAP